MLKDKIVPLSAIAALTVLELYALHKGIDGSLLSTIAAIIGGLGGYTIAKRTTAEN